MPEPTLDLDAHERFQKRDWRFQRAGWVAFAICIVAALAGAFGDGPLARGEARSADGKIVVEFDRLARRRAPTALRVHAAPGEGAPRVWIARGFLDRVEVKDIQPRPARVTSGQDRLVFEFAGEGSPSAAATTLTFSLQPTAFGIARCEMGLVGGPAVDFRQCVFP